MASPARPARCGWPDPSPATGRVVDSRVAGFCLLMSPSAVAWRFALCFYNLVDAEDFDRRIPSFSFFFFVLFMVIRGARCGAVGMFREEWGEWGREYCWSFVVVVGSRVVCIV